MKLYVRTTIDDLELPLVVADSIQELADKMNTSKNVVKSSISHKIRGWYRIECDDISGGYGR